MTTVEYIAKYSQWRLDKRCETLRKLALEGLSLGAVSALQAGLVQCAMIASRSTVTPQKKVREPHHRNKTSVV